MPVARSRAVKDSLASGEPIAPKKHRPAKVFKRQGKLSEAEVDLVTQLVQDQPREMPESQINALAKGLRRSRARIKEVVENARDRFVEQTDRYVDIHRQATEGALDTDDFKTAQLGAQWFLENVAAEGARMIDKAKVEAPKGTQIMIGIRMGGTTEALKTPVIEVESE